MQHSIVQADYFSGYIGDSFLLLHNDKVWIETVGDGNLCYNYIKLWRSILLTSTVELLSREC